MCFGWSLIAYCIWIDMDYVYACTTFAPHLPIWHGNMVQVSNPFVCSLVLSSLLSCSFSRSDLNMWNSLLKRIFRNNKKRKKINNSQEQYCTNIISQRRRKHNMVVFLKRYTFIYHRQNYVGCAWSEMQAPLYHIVLETEIGLRESP